MKNTIILLVLLMVVLFKEIWESITIESFNYQKGCKDEYADSIRIKRENEEKYSNFIDDVDDISFACRMRIKRHGSRCRD